MIKEALHNISVLVLLISAMLCSSCATIISGTTADIHLDGNVDEPLTVVTTHGEYQDLSLPATVKVKRRSLDGQHIQISSPSYAFSDIVLRKSVNPWSILDAFYTIPLFVDLMTNAASVPAQNRFFVTPDAPRSQADSLHRADSLRLVKADEELKQAQLLARQLPERYNRHEIRGGLGFGHCQASHDRDRMVDANIQRYNIFAEGECFDIVGDSYLQAGVEYHYRLNRKWDVGVLADWGISREGYSSYYFQSEHADPVTADPEYYAYANEQCRFFVFAPSLRYTWYEHRYFRSYSRIALGGMRHHLTFDYQCYPWVGYYPDDNVAYCDRIPVFTDSTDKIKWRMAYHLTAIGISFGSQSFNFYGELGYGSLGVVRFGACCMF